MLSLLPDVKLSVHKYNKMDNSPVVHGWPQLYLFLDNKSLAGQFYCPNVFTLSRPFRREAETTSDQLTSSVLNKVSSEIFFRCECTSSDCFLCQHLIIVHRWEVRYYHEWLLQSQVNRQPILASEGRAAMFSVKFTDGQIFYFAFNKNICREIGNISDLSLHHHCQHEEPW